MENNKCNNPSSDQFLVETTLKAGITFGALLAERFSWFLAGIKFGVLLVKIVQKPSTQSFLAGVKFGV